MKGQAPAQVCSDDSELLVHDTPHARSRAGPMSSGKSVLIASLLLVSACSHGGTPEHSLASPTRASFVSAATERQDAAAMYVLGTLFSTGTGVARDDAAALRWFIRASRLGNADAMNAVGIAYATGRGVEAPDLIKARRWFVRAANSGCAAAMNNIALAYYRGDGGAADYKQAARWYERAAAQGDASAMNVLATLYDDGKGVVEDHRKALALFEQSARLGHGLAMMNLGVAYARGEIVKQDNVLAFAWFGRALNAGLPDESRAQAAEAMKALAQRLSPDELIDARRLIGGGSIDPERRGRSLQYSGSSSESAQ